MTGSLNILFEDEYLLVVDKPAGLAVQTKNIAKEDLESLLRKELSGRQKPVYLAPINRLDQPVEGLVLFAKTREAAANLSSQLNAHTMEKIYRAKICGSFLPEREGKLTSRIIKDGRTNLSKVVRPEEPDYKEAKEAVLYYEEISPGDLKIRLVTGRHHQIRVQLADAGHPILGDMKYGNEASANETAKQGIHKLMLSAEELSFRHPKTGEQMVIRR